MKAPSSRPAAMHTRMSGGPPGDWKMEEKPLVGEGGEGVNVGVNDGLLKGGKVGRLGLSVAVVDMLASVRRAGWRSGSAQCVELDTRTPVVRSKGRKNGILNRELGGVWDGRQRKQGQYQCLCLC